MSIDVAPAWVQDDAVYVIVYILASAGLTAGFIMTGSSALAAALQAGGGLSLGVVVYEWWGSRGTDAEVSNR